MNSLNLAYHVINHIVKESKEKIRQNRLVKTLLVPYSYTIAGANRNDAILHVGTLFDRSSNNFFKNQIDSYQKPKNNIKDTYTFFSLKKSKLDKKYNLSLYIPYQNSPNKALKNFFKTAGKKSNTSQRYKISNKNNYTPAESTIQADSLKDTFFIKLYEEEVIIPKFMQKEYSHINYLRYVKNKELYEKETYRKRGEYKTYANTARQKKILSQLYSHLYKPNNHFTYDGEGEILFCNSETNKKAITKVYPPAMRYEVENKYDLRLKRKMSDKSRAFSNLYFKKREKLKSQGSREKGEMSMTQTINISNISLGNEQLDFEKFMRRNDRFNNNHSRQTTSIPFLRMEGGTMYKYTTTNSSISNHAVEEPVNKSANRKYTYKKTLSDTRARSHEWRARKYFRKYCFREELFKDFGDKMEHYSGKKLHSMTSKVFFKKINSIGDTRYSSFYIQRPYMTEVGKIKRENDTLYNSMLYER